MRACALWLNKESYLYIQWRHRSGRNGSDSAVGAPTGEPRKKKEKKSAFTPSVTTFGVPKQRALLCEVCVLSFRWKRGSVLYTDFGVKSIWLRNKGCHWNLNFHLTGMKLDQVNHVLFTFSALLFLFFFSLFFPSFLYGASLYVNISDIFVLLFNHLKVFFFHFKCWNWLENMTTENSWFFDELVYSWKIRILYPFT